MSIQTDLSREQMVRAWIANRIDGVSQQSITALLGITNSGRVSEAITVIDYALDNPDMLYRMARDSKKIENGEPL